MYTDKDKIRFFKKTLNLDNGCIAWVACVSGGYGAFYHNGKIKKAHRVACELAGIVIGDKHIDHLCRNTICVNPKHLEPVSLAENVRRGMHGVMQEKCIRGHSLSGENLFNSKIGKRVCKKCKSLLRKKYRARAKPPSPQEF